MEDIQTETNDQQSAGHRSAADNVRELTDASKQLLEAGKQMTDNLSELSERVEHAKNAGSDLLKSPWLVVTGAIAAGLLILAVSRR